MISLQNALPLLIFLVVCFLAFYFIETLILFALNWFMRKHWQLVVDKLLRAVVYHRIMVRMAACGSIALIVVLLFIFTPLADLLVAGTSALRLLALILAATMAVIYLMSRHTLSDIVIERRIHLYIFIILSLASFTGIMTLARQGYSSYEAAINQAFVSPIVENIEQKYENKLQNGLLDYFHSQIKKGGCPYFDYASKGGTTGVTQFIFLKDDPALATEKTQTRPGNQPLAGRRCEHNTTFLLTPDGKWYEVLEQ